MKKRMKWIVILAVSGVLALLGCSEDKITFDGDGPDGYEDVDLVEFEATSSTGGNPTCAVVIAFAPTDAGDIAEWQGSSLTFSKVELATDDGALVASFIRDDFAVDLASPDPIAATFTPQAGIAWRDLTLLREDAKVTLKLVHGGQTAEVSLPFGLLLTFAESETPWESGQTYGYLLVLPMATLLGQMQADTLNYDDLAATMSLYKDDNQNGLLDDGEDPAGDVGTPFVPTDGDSGPDGDVPAACAVVQASFAIPEGQKSPEPLDVVRLSAIAPDDDCGPYQCYWEWGSDGKPNLAQDAILIASTDSFDNPTSIMGKWTGECNPKIYVPIAGTYKIKMKMRNRLLIESGPSDDCPTCSEWSQLDIKVKPSQAIHVELLWDRGDDVDMDLFLVRYRTDGTMGIFSSYSDRIKGESTDYIECNSDADCEGGYCNPVTGRLESNKMVCTRHEADALNDSVFYGNNSPRWGDYEEAVLACTDSSDCSLLFENGDFSCSATCSCNGPDCEVASFDCCDFACSQDLQCLTASNEFLCDEELGTCIENMLDDDPVLDIDDVNGWGPENISLKNPVSGRYRVVARLYADPNESVSNKGPLAPAHAFVQVYLNGERALDKDLTTEFSTHATYWKVADIVWNAESGEDVGAVEPICAGWTQTECGSTADCEAWFGNAYACEQRNWGRFCSICENGNGTPNDCNPTETACTEDSDCAGESVARTCAEIRGSYCMCDGSNPYADFDADPYANPVITAGMSIFDPNSSSAPRSIWCDSPDATQFDGIDILSGGAACSSLYSE
jgi:hypothetical protein